ncbi:FAD-binding oxidoreductase [Vitreoscilla massiliensis]|uniref:FAD-binding oxidoreductase n=1 Tax=Vitreoscilla massiliensis TaxID=1689272 RepID=A0ABY4E374_9NEIS|nr:FAD-binding oxidoreductase [Vitreoscilla massiliensis]UOO89719.1 FAD-binding oxidoreductase [Vitreoscilla massiliensis]
MSTIKHLPKDNLACGWYHTSAKRTPKPALTGNIAARFVVVGAGLTGLAAARQLGLRFPNDEIVLVEAQEVGFGTSGRNSGFAIDLPHDVGSDDYIGEINSARHQLRLQKQAQEIIKSVVAEHNIDCGLEHAGKYQAAIEPEGLAVLESYKSGLERLGESYTIIEQDELPQHLGTSFYKRALFTPGTILIQPSAYVKGAADSLPANVTLYENTAITSVDYGAKVTLGHAHGTIQADKLVLTNNAFASSFGFLKNRLLPIFTYASMTRPLNEEEQAALGGKSTWGIIPAHPFGTTLRRTPDNRLLVRNSMTFNPNGKCTDAHLKTAYQRHVQSYQNRFPMLPNVEFEYTWGGAMCLSRNHMTFFGELAPNVYGSLCCNGLGITRGTIGGHLLADWLAGDRNESIDYLLNAEKPCANPPEPLLSTGVNANLMLGQRKAGLEA